MSNDPLSRRYYPMPVNPKQLKLLAEMIDWTQQHRVHLPFEEEELAKLEAAVQNLIHLDNLLYGDLE